MNGDSSSRIGSGPANAYSPEHAHSDDQIISALKLVYDSHTPNDQRHSASIYLEQIKAQDEAPYHGFGLAADRSHAAVVRHFGLSLLEHAIRQRWAEYTVEQNALLREWIVKLAQSVTKEDALFIRNKIAQLWVEVAKRSWALDWLDMDELLVQLWDGSVTQKEFVLEVLETLSENSFGKEDVTTALRGHDLGKACVEIFTPVQIMAEYFPRRDTSIHVRFGDEGWFSRISDFLGWCNSESFHSKEAQSCAIKVLTTLKSVVSWAILHALAKTNCVQRICGSLTAPNQAMQLGAVEALNGLYYRTNFSNESIEQLVWPLYERDTTDVLKQLYEWSVVDEKNIEENKYLLCKKFSEMIYNVGKFLVEKPESFPVSADLPNFLNLLLLIVRNDSLHVSIPILHLWAQLLQSSQLGSSPPVMSLIGPLLEICSQRFIRYEAVPEDSPFPAIVFLKEDIDTLPERHAFLGNYARFCRDVVDSIVQKQPFDALQHILGQADQVLQHLYDRESPFQPQTYSKASIPGLKLDAQFSVVEAALIGYGKWRGVQKAKHPDGILTEQENIIIPSLEQWCSHLLELTFEDPTIHQRVVHLVAEFIAGPLRRNTTFIIKVFHFMMNTKIRLLNIPRHPGTGLYNEAMDDCQRFCSHQLQRVAIRSADDLISYYDEIERKILDYCQITNVEQQDRDRAVSMLFIISQRATAIDDEQRQYRLEGFIRPTMNKWEDPRLSNLLANFEGFCNLLGLAGLREYFVNRKVHQIQDWTNYALDDEGRALKARIDAAQNDLPFRATKTFLAASVERTEVGSKPQEAARVLWCKYLPVILPSLLQFISLAHLFSDPSSWMDLPLDLRDVPGRVLRDRFWQVGISAGSRDDFYAQVEGSKSTLEGLASAIRGSLRLVRETGYRLLLYMSMLGDSLYTYDELPAPLSKALFVDASALSIHQMGVILDGIRPLIDNCPVEARGMFLPAMITAMFAQLDFKVSKEWKRIEQLNKAASVDDNLLEEMKDESILRQLTYNSVTLVVSLLDPAPTPAEVVRQQQSLPVESNPTTDTSLRRFVLRTPEILKSVILFCAHALSMHDSRACGLITRVLRSIIPSFSRETTPVAADVREFISTEVLKACITSLHDPYFVDLQSDLAQLIASIILSYARLTDTPRNILRSLPDMTDVTVDSALHRLDKATAGRQQRAVILKFLEGLRGVSISEQGKLPRKDPKMTRSSLQDQYMQTDAVRANEKRGPSPELGGVADMFQEQ